MTFLSIEKNNILRRIAEGDQAAVADCLDFYGNLVWFLAKKYTNTKEDAEDAVQEIFLDIWQHAARFDAEKASESTFIALIARRRLIDRLRKRTRQPQLQNLEDVTAAVYPRNSEREMQVNLDARRVSQIINRLRPEQKQVINLAIFGGLTHTEIAERTGMPLGTVKTLIRRGFQKVRDSFGIGEDGFAAA
jgi:RNA polymerase sigma-70 factor, ECF subfamily